MPAPTYTPTTWVNNTAPAISADNLNHIEQGVAAATNGVTITYTVSQTLSGAVDGIAVFNGSTLTATLPDPTTVPVGRRFTVKNVNASALTVASAGTSKKIDGAASQSVAQWGKLTVFTDGTQWLSM